MVHSISFSEDEETIRKYALLHGMNGSEVMEMAIRDITEDEVDLKDFIESKKRFESNPVAYSHETVGRELGFR